MPGPPSSPEPRRLLVTGANGHVGRRLIARSLREGHAVRAVVRSPRAAAALEPLEHASLEVQELDPTDADALSRACDGVTHVAHLIGILKEGGNARYKDAHEATTTALVRAAAKAGVARVVYLSILGSTPERTNACLASKARAERILLDGEVPGVVLRVPMVLGPGEIAAAALRAKAAAPFVFLVRGGATLEQPIDSEDVVEAIVRALEAPGLEDTALDLAGPESLSHRELVARAAQLAGGEPSVVPLPLAVAKLGALLGELTLTDPPFTRTMLDVLEHDDAIDPAPACARLGLELTPLDETLRRCFEDEAAG